MSPYSFLYPASLAGTVVLVAYQDKTRWRCPSRFLVACLLEALYTPLFGSPCAGVQALGPVLEYHDWDKGCATS